MGLTKPRATQIYNLDYKQATRVATSTNITLVGGAPNQVDGVNLSLNDRVLVTGQNTASENGLYDVDTVGAGENGTWVRTGDGNETGEIEAGMIVMVTEGVVYADTQWKLITDNPIFIGDTPLIFVFNIINVGFSSISAGGNVLTASGNSSLVNFAAGDGMSIVGNNVSNTITFISTGGGGSGSSISNGTSNVNVVSSGGNITVGVGGTGNVVQWATTGEYVTGVVSATGNVTGNYILGNGALLTGVTTSSNSIFNGNSNVTVTSSGGNVTTGVGGTANVLVTAATGVYVTGVLSASGNVIGGGVRTTTAATPPSSPSVGDVWYNTTNTVLYRYSYDGTSDYWQDLSGGSIAQLGIGNVVVGTISANAIICPLGSINTLNVLDTANANIAVYTS